MIAARIAVPSGMTLALCVTIICPCGWVSPVSHPTSLDHRVEIPSAPGSDRPVSTIAHITRTADTGNSWGVMPDLCFSDSLVAQILYHLLNVRGGRRARFLRGQPLPFSENSPRRSATGPGTASLTCRQPQFSQPMDVIVRRILRSP